MVAVLVTSDWCSPQRQMNEAFQLHDEFSSRMSSHEALRMARWTSRKCLGAETGCWKSGSEIQRQIDHQMHHFTTPKARALSPIRCNGVRHIRACTVTFTGGRGLGRRISTIEHGKGHLGRGQRAYPDEQDLSQAHKRRPGGTGRVLPALSSLTLGTRMGSWPGACP